MRKFLFSLLAAMAAATAQSTIDQKIKAEIGGFKGTVYLYAENLDNAQSYGLLSDERVRTASTIKLAIMAEVFHAVAIGQARFNEFLPLTVRNRVSGSGVVRELSLGLRLPIRDLTNLMIVVSDNTATNLLLDRFTADAVNAETERLGLKQTRSLRKILGDGKNVKPEAEGLSAAGKVKDNERFGIGVTTPREMVQLISMMERGHVVSAEASREMMRILERQQYKDGIGRHMGELKVASKSGSLDHLRSDVGIVYSPGGRIAMAITVEDIPDIDYSEDNPGLLLLSRLAGILVDDLGRKP